MEPALELLQYAGVPGIVVMAVGAAASGSAARRAWISGPPAAGRALAPLIALLVISAAASRLELMALSAVPQLPAEDRSLAIANIIGARCALPVITFFAAAPALALGLLFPHARARGPRDWRAAMVLACLVGLTVGLPFTDVEFVREVGPAVLVYLPVAILGLRTADVMSRSANDGEVCFKAAAEWLLLIAVTTMLVLATAQIMGINGSSVASRAARLTHKLSVLDRLVGLQIAQVFLAALSLVWATRGDKRLLASAGAAAAAVAAAMWGTTPPPHVLWLLTVDYYG